MNTETIREALDVLGRTIDQKPGLRADALTALNALEAEIASLRAACEAARKLPRLVKEIEHTSHHACPPVDLLKQYHEIMEQLESVMEATWKRPTARFVASNRQLSRPQA